MVCFEDFRIAKVMLNGEDVTELFFGDNYDYLPYLFTSTKEIFLDENSIDYGAINIEANNDWNAKTN